jgi:hypothetical protein
MEPKEVREDLKVIKNDMIIKEVTSSMILDKIEWWRRRHAVDPN